MALLKSGRLTALAVRQMSSSATPVKPIDLTVDAEGIATLTLNNKPVNALSLAFMRNLNSCLEDIEKENFRGVVLTSAIPNVFCAGLNLKEVLQPDIEVLATLLRSMQDIWIKLFGSNFVTAAAINGHSPAGGCMLAMSCEYRAMVAADYRIGLNETAIGLIPDNYFIETMRHTIGSRQTEIALTSSKMFTPTEALQVGLVDTLVDNQEACVEKCKNYIRKFAKIYPVARATTKQIVRGGILKNFIDNREYYLEQQLKSMDEETIESLRLYVKKLQRK